MMQDPKFLNSPYRRAFSARKDKKKKEVLISKQYDLTLPCGKINHKKVAYQNRLSTRHVFKVKSSNPNEMVIKTREIEIEANEKAKFGLRFREVKRPCVKKYVIFILKEG